MKEFKVPDGKFQGYTVTPAGGRGGAAGNVGIIYEELKGTKSQLAPGGSCRAAARTRTRRQCDCDRNRTGLYLALLRRFVPRLGVVLHARPDSHAGGSRRALGRQSELRERDEPADERTRAGAAHGS